MKKTIFAVLAGIMLSAFTNNIPGKELAGYKLKADQVISLNDYNLWAITNEEYFDNTFEAIHSPVSRPKFETELALAAKVETENNSYKVVFKKVVVEKETMNVYFNVERKSAKLINDSSVSLITWPKTKGVHKVNFYHGNLMVKSVSLVEVY